MARQKKKPKIMPKNFSCADNTICSLLGEGELFFMPGIRKGLFINDVTQVREGDITLYKSLSKTGKLLRQRGEGRYENLEI